MLVWKDKQVSCKYEGDFFPPVILVVADVQTAYSCVPIQAPPPSEATCEDWCITVARLRRILRWSGVEVRPIYPRIHCTPSTNFRTVGPCSSVAAVRSHRTQRTREFHVKKQCCCVVSFACVFYTWICYRINWLLNIISTIKKHYWTEWGGVGLDEHVASPTPFQMDSVL